MAIQNYQMKYRNLLMGPNTAYKIDSVDGLEALTVRPDDIPFARGHGEASGKYYASYKLITIKLDVVGDAGTQTHADNVKNLRAAFSVGGGLAGDTYYDTSSPNDDADRLYFKRPNQAESFVYARPYKRSDIGKQDSLWGIVPVTIQLRCADPYVYENLVNVVNEGVSPYIASGKGIFSITHDGTSNAYPIIELQHLRVKVRQESDPGGKVDQAAVHISNFGAKDFSGKTEPEISRRDIAISYFRLENLNQINEKGIFDTNTTYSTTDWDTYTPSTNEKALGTNIDVPTIYESGIPATINKTTWEDIPTGTLGVLPTASDKNPLKQTPKELLCSSIVYRCDMEVLSRGKNQLAIYRYGFRPSILRDGPGAWRFAQVVDKIHALDENEYVNEYGKGQPPRDPFFLIPGVNNIRVWADNTIVRIFYRNTHL